jgi:hypothetical protein
MKSNDARRFKQWTQKCVANSHVAQHSIVRRKKKKKDRRKKKKKKKSSKNSPRHTLLSFHFRRHENVTVKVVIRGDRKTGKSQLWRRVQQKAFEDEYSPTPAIQIAHINWSYKVHDDPVLVEVWDVVDHASQSASTSTAASELKLSHHDNTNNNNNGSSLSLGDSSSASASAVSSPLPIPSAVNATSAASSPNVHSHQQQSAATPLSADVVDVYQLAQCVIFHD